MLFTLSTEITDTRTTEYTRNHGLAHLRPHACPLPPNTHTQVLTYGEVALPNSQPGNQTELTYGEVAQAGTERERE